MNRAEVYNYTGIIFGKIITPALYMLTFCQGKAVNE